MHQHKLLVIGLGSVIALGASTLFAEEVAAETKNWESSIALGMTLNDGNTDNSMYNGALTLGYRPCDKSSVRVGVDAAYGENDGDKSTDNGKAVLDYRYLLSERSFASFNSSAAYDDIADLDYRWIVSPGLGYHIMKQEHVFLLGEAGPALIGEKKGGDGSTEKFALRFANRYERQMDTGAKYWQAAEYLPLIDDFDIYIINAEIGVEAPISQKLNIRLVARNTYDSNPAEDRDHNDLTVIGALAYTIN